MEDLLYKYMSQRFNDKNHEESINSTGPVLTISRAAGCTSGQLVNELALRLNQNRKDGLWEVISKEILHHSAEILKLEPEKVKAIFETKNRSLFDEIVQTFISGDYQLEKKMIKTVINVIHRFGVEGHKIIIGRAANIICSDIPNALHVRIEAPLNWRIERVEKCRNISKEDAANYINQTEKNRDNFRKTIKGETAEARLFDLVINQAAFVQKEIIDIIINAMKVKNLI